MPSLFISYSHSDKAIAEKAEAYFSKIDFEVLRDDSLLSPGDNISQVLLDNIKKADGCILLISKQTLDSGWVNYEVNNALLEIVNNKSSKYQIFPLIVEEGIHPSDFPQLAQFMWGDITIPVDDEIWFQKIANKCLENLNLEKRISNSKLTAAAAELTRSPEYDRIIRMVKAVFETDISDLKKNTEMINEAILSQNHILTQKMIAYKEKIVSHEIWVITKHLYNDTEDEDIRRSVTQNLKRDIQYKYFIVKSDLVDRRLKKYMKHHFEGEGCDKGLVQFYELPEDFVLTSSEIVIYDPIDYESVWGYFQVRYGKITDLQAADLFFEVSDNDIKSIVRSVEVGIENKRYRLTDIDDV